MCEGACEVWPTGKLTRASVSRVFIGVSLVGVQHMLGGQRETRRAGDSPNCHCPSPHLNLGCGGLSVVCAFVCMLNASILK